MSNSMSDPDSFARAIVQQYLFEHGMHSGNKLKTLGPPQVWQVGRLAAGARSDESCCAAPTMIAVSHLLSSLR